MRYYNLVICNQFVKFLKLSGINNTKLNQNTWGVKKVQGQEPATKSSDIK